MNYFPLGCLTIIRSGSNSPPPFFFDPQLRVPCCEPRVRQFDAVQWNKYPSSISHLPPGKPSSPTVMNSPPRSKIIIWWRGWNGNRSSLAGLITLILVGRLLSHVTRSIFFWNSPLFPISPSIEIRDPLFLHSGLTPLGAFRTRSLMSPWDLISYTLLPPYSMTEFPISQQTNYFNPCPPYPSQPVFAACRWFPLCINPLSLSHFFQCVAVEA